MYLKYMQLRNFKNFQASSFSLKSGSNVIIGENDSGKSNAMKALRILLDDTYYYGRKNLKESDFSKSLSDWKGHWIVISVFFDDITTDDVNNEIAKDLIPDDENIAFLNSYIKSGENDYGTLTLYIRPQYQVRKSLYEANDDDDEFKKIRESITIEDYEFVYKSRSQYDFTEDLNYLDIVGDIENHQYNNPDDDNEELLGANTDITEIWQYISVVYIDALRDVAYEMRKSNNPISKVVNNITSTINKSDITTIQNIIDDLNKTISSVDKISEVGTEINTKLHDIVGYIYSPHIKLQSNLDNEFDSLIKFLTLSSEDDELNYLGLGHLNVLYIALKLVEFKYTRNRELLNIMIIEEPEAHIHVHIQKTLFDNLNSNISYTQVIMTTHSTHLSEVSEIKRVNILKKSNLKTITMFPSNKLEAHGKELLDFDKYVSLVNSVERYLDTKRSTLLFAKGIILVEGDGEEILIPHLVKKVLGVSLDELGISIVNIGSVSFEYIAMLYHEDRIQRNCAIITDLDKQLEGADRQKANAEEQGKTRKEKLEGIFEDNIYVEPFFAEYTLEIDFVNESQNIKYIENLLPKIYKDANSIESHTQNLNGNIVDRYNSMQTILTRVMKGWFALLLSEEIDSQVIIPDYILNAIIFASIEVMKDNINHDIFLKMIKYTIDSNNEVIDPDPAFNQETSSTIEDKDKYIQQFIEENSNSIVAKYLERVYEK